MDSPVFRIGDRVRGFCGGGTLHGGLGTVVAGVGEMVYEVMVDDYTYPVGCASENPGAGTFGANALELVDPTPPPAEPKPADLAVAGGRLAEWAQDRFGLRADRYIEGARIDLQASSVAGVGRCVIELRVMLTVDDMVALGDPELWV